jgi:hypothetical protein
MIDLLTWYTLPSRDQSMPLNVLGGQNPRSFRDWWVDCPAFYAIDQSDQTNASLIICVIE